MDMQMIPKVMLKRHGRHGSEAGHPWVYQSEIDYVKGKFAPGDIVDVYNCRQQYLGRGYINPRSQITIRLLSREEETIDRDFLQGESPVRGTIVNAFWKNRNTVD